MTGFRKVFPIIPTKADTAFTRIREVDLIDSIVTEKSTDEFGYESAQRLDNNFLFQTSREIPFLGIAC